MPFDGSGNYTPASAPNFPAVSGDPISSTYYNAVINDIATALSNTLTRDGQGKPLGPIGWNNQNLTGVASLAAVAAAISTTLGVTGATTLSSTLAVTGAATLASTLGVAGVTTLSGAVNTAGVITTAVTAAGQESLILPHGANPTAPTNGSLWTKTTGLYAQINGVTEQAVFVGDSPANLTMSTASLLGRATGGSGAVEEITLGAGLSFVGNVLTMAADAGGTVTSVAMSGGTTGLTFTGGPITTNGTFTAGGTLAVANGGTGGTTQATARTGLGLGSIATQASSNVTITGGSVTGITDLALADGGTGASTQAAAFANIAIAASNLASGTGYIEFANGFTIQWETFVIPANTSSHTYTRAYSSWSKAWTNGDDASADVSIYVISTSATSVSIGNGGGSCTITLFSIGV